MAFGSKATGGEIIARMLADEGVEHVFGIVDGTYFGLYSNLEKHGIELVSPRHETCAAHMAGAYARTTGRLGVCMASNGPGVANILPGVAVENGEGNRVLLLTSSRRSGITYPDRGGTFQYFDQVGVISPMAKWSGSAPTHDRIPELMRRAFRMSWRGRPGVVHVDAPEDVMNNEAAMDDSLFVPPRRYRRRERLRAHPDDIEQAARMLAAAKLPLIHAGNGIYHAGATRELQEVARLLEAPVTTSWAGRGAVPETDDHAIPLPALDVNEAVRNEADIVLTVGSRLGETDWWGKPPHWGSPAEQEMIQVDVDEEILGLNKPADLAILADAKDFLAALATALSERSDVMPLDARRTALARHREGIEKQRRDLDKPLRKRGTPVHPAHVPTICQEVLDEDTIWVFDGGNTTVWSNFYHEARTPRSLLSTFKFGMLGAGVSQSLGAKVAHPDRTVCCLIGDGAFGMHPQEVETAVRHDLPVVYVVFSDRQWGMVKMSQQMASKPVKSVAKKMLANQSLSDDELVGADLTDVRYDHLAEALGGHGEHVTHPDDLEPALRRSVDTGRAAVIHVEVDRVEHMWAPGLRAFKAMHEEPGG